MPQVIPRLCSCEPEMLESRVDEHGTSVVACTRCGASAVPLGRSLPAFVLDQTPYEVFVELDLGLVKQHIGLLKAKSGLTTPELVDLARRHGRLVLHRAPHRVLHYELQELAAAGLPVQVVPPYPHALTDE
jgi:hypothetical protein